MRRRVHASLFALSVAVVTAPVTEAQDVPAWEPKGPWQLEEQPDQCSLLRRFVSGDRHLVLQVQPTIFSTTYDIVLAGTGLVSDFDPGALRFSLVGSAQDQDVQATPGKASGSGEPLIQWTIVNDAAFMGAVADDQVVRVVMDDRLDLSLNLRGARKALAAVRDCEDDVAATQGIDASTVRLQSRAPAPANYPGYWATFQDYPSQAMREGMQGIVGFRLTIDTKGAVAACRITSTSGHSLLDQKTCALMKERARFTPALGPDGKPSVGYYSNRVSWAMP